MTQPVILQSIFPDVPREHPAVMKDGNFTELWELFFGALSQALQVNFKNEGIVIPPLSAANMATIQSLYAAYVGGTYNALTAKLPDISGQTVFDSDTKTTNQFIIATSNPTPPTLPVVLLAKWVPLAYIITNPTPPAGAVAGVTNWLCYSISNTTLYICTATGNAASATWQPI